MLNRTRPTDYDPAEEQAYLHAVSGSLPIIHNTQLCSSNTTDLIFFIISSGSHFLERQSVRETWGSMPNVFNVHSQRLFVMGYHSRSNLFRDISNEAQHEKDILYLTVDDDSMTMKELYGYRWLEKYCPNVTFTFKTEDDLFVNSLLLHEIVQELKTKSDQFQTQYLYNISLNSLFVANLNSNAHKFLFGWAYEPGKPERNTKNVAFYVSQKEYSKALYPPYCSGSYLFNYTNRFFC